MFEKLQHLLEDKEAIAKENALLQELKLAKEEAKMYQEKLKKSGRNSRMFYDSDCHNSS